MFHPVHWCPESTQHRITLKCMNPCIHTRTRTHTHTHAHTHTHTHARTHTHTHMVHFVHVSDYTSNFFFNYNLEQTIGENIVCFVVYTSKMKLCPLKIYIGTMYKFNYPKPNHIIGIFTACCFTFTLNLIIKNTAFLKHASRS